MRYKAIVLDLDGTLMNSQKELSTENQEALMRLQQEQATKIILASGRPTYGIVPVAKKLDLARYGGYILAYNGCEVIECSTMKVIDKRAVDTSLHGKIYELTKSAGCTLVTYLDDIIITEDATDEYALYEANLNRMEMQEVPDLLETLRSNNAEPCKMLAVGAPEKILALQESINAECGDMICAFRSEQFFLEIVPLNIDKGATLQRIFPMLGITPEQTIGFGDGYNDLTLIEAVGHGVAMLNAQQELKDIAQDVTILSNDEHGVAHYITQNML